MKEHYHIFVEGTPQPQPRPRKGKHGNIYSPDPKQGWKEAVQIAFLQKRQPIIYGPISLTIRFLFSKSGIEAGKTLPHTQKPDRDNLEKAVMDALNGLVWKDDCQVCGGYISKRWTSGKAGAEIWIEEYE